MRELIHPYLCKVKLLLDALLYSRPDNDIVVVTIIPLLRLGNAFAKSAAEIIGRKPIFLVAWA